MAIITHCSRLTPLSPCSSPQLLPVRYQRCVPAGRVSAHPEHTETFGQHLAAPTSLRFALCCSWYKASNQGCTFLCLKSVKVSPLRHTSLSSVLLSAAQTAPPTPQIQHCWVRNRCALGECSKQRSSDPPRGAAGQHHHSCPLWGPLGQLGTTLGAKTSQETPTGKAQPR